MSRNNKNSGFGFLGIIIVIALITALGGGAYYSSKKASVGIDADANASTTGRLLTNTGRGNNSTTSANTVASAGASTKVTVGAFSVGSMRNLLNANQDIECSIGFSTTTSKGELKTDGAVFISGNNMRGDFKMVGDAAVTSEAHMIRQGDTVIAWTGNTGAKISFNAMTAASASASNNGQVNLDQNVSYRCMEWTKDDAKFQVPAEVKIMDVSAMMQGAANMQVKP